MLLCFLSPCVPLLWPHKGPKKWTLMPSWDVEPGKTSPKSVVCHYCSKPGHIAINCYKKKNDADRKSMGGEKIGSGHSYHELSGVKFVTLQIGDRVERLLVDTGVSVSVLPNKLFTPTDMKSISLRLADGSNMQSDGQGTFSVRMLDGVFLAEHDFCIDNVKKCYLGYDLLKKLGASIHTQGEGFIIGSGDWRIPLERQDSDGAFDTSVMVLADIDFDDVEFLTGDVPEADVKITSSVCDSTSMKKMDEILDSYDDLSMELEKVILWCITLKLQIVFLLIYLRTIYRYI